MDIIFKNADILDVVDGVVIQGQDLAVSGGEIVAIGPGLPSSAESVDVSGKLMCPGFINAHTHLLSDPSVFTGSPEPKASKLFLLGQLNALKQLRSGFTFLRDLGGSQYVDVDLREAIDQGKIPGPGLKVAGRALTITGGHGCQSGIECDGEAGFIKGARETIKNGADIVKIMVTGGVLSPNSNPRHCPVLLRELCAAVETAKAQGRRTAAHVHSALGIKNAVTAGIDSVEHGVFLDDEALELMVRNGTYYVPTLLAPLAIARNAKDGKLPAYLVSKAEAMLETHKAAFKKALAAGARIAFGCDSGTPFNHHDGALEEFLLLVEAGMTPLEAIRSATLTAAELLGIGETHGRLSPGRRADFIVFDKSPLDDIRAVLGPKAVYRSGRLVV